MNIIRSWLKYLCYCLIVYTSSIYMAFANPQTLNTSSHKLRIGVILEMPFAQNIDGHYSGIAVDIWDSIASMNGWDYTYIPLSANINRELTHLNESNDLDAIIGPISVNSERLQIVDFTRPFFLSSIGVIAKKHNLDILDVLKTFFSKVLIFSILILIGSFIIFIHLLWYLERGKLTGVSTNYYSALSKDMWQHLFKNGLMMPSTLMGRLITLVWILIAALLITSINANYTAAMTVNLSQTNSKITTLDDLRTVKVAGVDGQLNVQVAENNGITVQKTDNFEQAMELLLQSDVDAVVCDAPIGIEYLRLHGSKHYVMSSLIIENDELAFAVPLNSTLRYKIDLGITKLQDNDSVITICRRYIGEEASRCDM